MSAGAARPTEGRATAVPAPHRVLIQRLEAERRQADWCHESGRVAELDAQIARLSAGSPVNPAAETTGRPSAAARRKTDGRASGIRQR